MDDVALSRLIARDLDDYLADAGPRTAGPTYAISLWADEVYGLLTVVLATQASFHRRRNSPIYRAVVSDEEADGPTFRWYSGDWDTQPEEFLSSATRAASQPLTDSSADDEALAPLWRRWRKIAYTVVGQLRPPAALPLTPDALHYVEFPDATPAEAAMVMLRTVEPRRFHTVIPAWRLLAETVRFVRADPARMTQLHHQADQAAAGLLPFPRSIEPAPDLLTARLRACGLEWYDLASGTDRLELALAVAGR